MTSRDLRLSTGVPTDEEAAAWDAQVDPFAPDLLEPDEGVVVSASGSGADRHARLRPTSADRATPEQHQALHDLAIVALRVRDGQAALRELVAEARSVGVSWGLIGWSVGLTGEGARQRYGTPEPSPRSSKLSRRRPR